MSHYSYSVRAKYREGETKMHKNLNILIADDAHSMRSLIKGVLLKAGFVNFAEADNGLAVMQKLEQEQFHLVICDWDMPKMDGIEVLRNMRADESHFKIPFILLTAITDATKVVAAIEEGVDDYIIKPLKPDNFIQRVKEVLKNSRVANH